MRKDNSRDDKQRRKGSSKDDKLRDKIIEEPFMGGQLIKPMKSEEIQA